MLAESGRVYHPGPDRLGGVGLVKSSLAIELSKSFEFSSDDDSQAPSHFTWREKKYTLTNELLPLLDAEKDRKATMCDQNV